MSSKSKMITLPSDLSTVALHTVRAITYIFTLYIINAKSSNSVFLVLWREEDEHNHIHLLATLSLLSLFSLLDAPHAV